MVKSIKKKIEWSCWPTIRLHVSTDRFGSSVIPRSNATWQTRSFHAHKTISHGSTGISFFLSCTVSQSLIPSNSACMCAIKHMSSLPHQPGDMQSKNGTCKVSKRVKPVGIFWQCEPFADLNVSYLSKPCIQGSYLAMGKKECVSVSRLIWFL